MNKELTDFFMLVLWGMATLGILWCLNFLINLIFPEGE